MAIYTIYLNMYDQRFIGVLFHEDGILESAEAILYLLASIGFLYLCKKQGFKNIWIWGLAVLFFLIAGEEISWGQRIFSIATPESIADINVQQELNVHNINGIHQHVRLFGVIVILTICYLIPASDRFIGSVRRFYKKIKMPVFPLWAVGIPTIAILFMVIPRVFYGVKDFNMDEAGELYLAIGFFIFLLDQLKQSRPATPIKPS